MTMRMSGVPGVPNQIQTTRKSGLAYTGENDRERERETERVERGGGRENQTRRVLKKQKIERS